MVYPSACLSTVPGPAQSGYWGCHDRYALDDDSFGSFESIVGKYREETSPDSVQTLLSRTVSPSSEFTKRYNLHLNAGAACNTPHLGIKMPAGSTYPINKCHQGHMAIIEQSWQRVDEVDCATGFTASTLTAEGRQDGNTVAIIDNTMFKYVDFGFREEDLLRQIGMEIQPSVLS